MKIDLKHIVKKPEFTKDDLIAMLSVTDKEELKILYNKANEVKQKYVGNKVYFRGLIEFSNKCTKNCLYCGIRGGNTKVERYDLTDKEILDAVDYAWENKFGSIVMQSGERSDKAFTDRVLYLLEEIKKRTNGELGVTLSCGEQSRETYEKWFAAGAHRYLLRIESSNEELYYKIHPRNANHSFKKRMEALHTLKRVGYQVGTGVMIGLPYQTISDLADDLLFFKSFDVDMVGMGPYVEHSDTPLYEYRNWLMPQVERLELALKMVAVLRLLMKDINIAAATALQAIEPMGREMAVQAGANIIMPNMTVTEQRDNYLLYENKPCTDEDITMCKNCLEVKLKLVGAEIGYGEWGDSHHFENKNKDK